jgi:hypothetical protein
MRRSPSPLLCAFVALALCLALPVAAQEGSTEANAEPKVTFHGYLSQAFGISDDNQYLGITSDGTTEYRTAALQFRYVPSDKDGFVLQLSHEVLGASATNQLRSDVELDWVYYERRLGEASLVRIGRVPLPIGIYNEIKDVGTLLPFYRASTGIYGDGTWTSDTVDGVVVSHPIALGSRWSLDTDFYYGNWKRIEDDTSVPRVSIADITNAFGTQLWLNTPVEGVRLGFGANRIDATGGEFQKGFTDTQKNFYYSLDASFERVMVRVEYYDDRYTGGDWKAIYGEVVVKATDRLRLMANMERGDMKFTVPDFAVFEGNWNKEVGVGLNYAFRPDLVLKVEHHWHEGYDIEAQPVDAFFGPQLKADYALVSLSYSF